MAKKKTKLTRRRDSNRLPTAEPPAPYFDNDKTHATFSTGCTVFDCVLGGGWIMNRIINVIGDKCLSGDTIVSVQRGIRPRKMSIKTLYARVHGNHHNRSSNVTTEVLVDKGGFVGLQSLADIRKTGKKELFRIVNDRGQTIKASADHRFWAKDGWATLNDSGLRVGTQVWVWCGKKTGQAARKKCSTIHSITYHPHAGRHVIGDKNYKRAATARLVIEAAMNDVTLKEFVRVLRGDAARASTFIYSDPDLHVHHKDRDNTNNALDNLELLDPRSHGVEHADEAVRALNRTVLSTIVSIESIGVYTTYDLSMAAPHHNFIADGYVVHNSTGKTLLAIEAAANFIRKFPDGRIQYVESEAAFDVEYAEQLGLPVDSLDMREECDTVEDVFEDISELIVKAQTPRLYIVDSLDALTSRDEAKASIDAASYGMQKAKVMSQMFRRLVRKLQKSEVTVMIISQVRDKINAAAFGKKTTRSGGRALDFYASQIVELAHLKRRKIMRRKVERVVGIDVQAHVAKNKVGPPFRTAKFPVLFGYGIEDILASVEFLKSVGEGSNLDVKLSTLSLEEYDELREEYATRVKTKWQEIEREFAPTRRKYR